MKQLDKLWANLEKVVFVLVLIVALWTLYGSSESDDTTGGSTKEVLDQANEDAGTVKKQLGSPVILNELKDYEQLIKDSNAPAPEPDELKSGMSFSQLPSSPPDHVAIEEVEKDPDMPKLAQLDKFNIQTSLSGIEVQAAKTTPENPANVIGAWVFIKRKQLDNWPKLVGEIISETKDKSIDAKLFDKEVLSHAYNKIPYKFAGNLLNAVKVENVEPDTEYELFAVIEGEYPQEAKKAKGPNEIWLSRASEIQSIMTLKQTKLIVTYASDSSNSAKFRVGKFHDGKWIYDELPVDKLGHRGFNDVSDGRIRGAQKHPEYDLVIYDAQHYFLRTIKEAEKIEDIQEAEAPVDPATGLRVFEGKYYLDKSTFKESPSAVLIQLRTGVESHHEVDEYGFFEPELKVIYARIKAFMDKYVNEAKKKGRDDLIRFVDPNQPVAAKRKAREKFIYWVGFPVPGINDNNAFEKGFFRNPDAVKELDKIRRDYKTAGSTISIYDLNKIRELGEKNNW